jgi:hypothetical protein
VALETVTLRRWMVARLGGEIRYLPLRRHLARFPNMAISVMTAPRMRPEWETLLGCWGLGA